MSSTPLLQVSALCKAYGGVRALEPVSLEIQRGEILALCGENGAGKSTLIKCLAGVVRPDGGTAALDGRPLPWGSVPASEEAGIAVIHQESAAFPDLNALDNIFVGREPRRRGGLLDRRRMRREAQDLLDKLGHPLPLDRPVGQLAPADRQMVSLARALSRRCRLLVLDEPTASLSLRESQTLARLVRRLRDEGVSVLYVSHRLEEIFELADRVATLRDGRLVATRDVQQLDQAELIRLMVGRELDELAARHEHGGGLGEVRLELRQLTRRGHFADVSLQVRSGEIVTLAGLIGAGRTEVARAVFGLDHYDGGQVLLNGQALTPGSVTRAMQAGLALVPEDRQHQGLLLPMPVAANLSLAVLRRLTWGPLVDAAQERQLAEDAMRQLQIKAAGLHVSVDTLSGGNQQKVVLGKWLAAEPRVLILDEPTRGVDVAAKSQVHRLVRELAAGGLATLLISSDLPEVLSISDRILVMCEGRIRGELPGASATQEQVLQLALPPDAGIAASWTADVS